MKTDTSEHLKPRSQYAEDAVQLAIAGKWDEAVKLNRFIIESFGADEETQNRLGKSLSELIDERPRAGIRGSRVAFLHPRATAGVLTEIVQPAEHHGAPS